MFLRACVVVILGLNLSACSRQRSENQPANVVSVGEHGATATSHGGVTDGNGGTVIVCNQLYPELLNRKVVVLDRFEAVQKKFSTSIGETVDDTLVKVTKALDRIKSVDPRRFEVYSGYAAKFLDDASIAPNLQLPQLPDVGVVALPGPDCHVENIAIQVTPEFPGDHLYVIKKELWDQLDADDQAALIRLPPASRWFGEWDRLKGGWLSSCHQS